MTNLQFRKALKEGSPNVIFMDANDNNKEYTHTILRAGKKQVNLYNNYLESEYKLRFGNYVDGVDFKQYKLKL